MKGVNINIDSLREFRSLQNGFVDLSPGNYKFYSNVLLGLISLLSDERVRPVILDVGANDGWFAKVVYRFLGKEASVISFEPLKSMSQKLQAIADRFKYIKDESYALGSTNGVVEITEYSTSIVLPA
ncbi:FkbM family methyltransferase [Polynucleobacter necessarius]|uniref:FkbM family methyltransferase n=1 Tax=Polynucleobacter necessarius TaxID=576610 RepID=UPI000E09006E|nr:FkbM family methyltransferase [Polynucleobacter necessarius]